MSEVQDLIESIKKRNVILFVGGGVSATLGLPSWDHLIEHIAVELNYDKETFKSFGNHLTLAEFYTLSKGSIGELRSWMDINLHNSDITIEESKVYKYIVDLNFPIIYTTNYDRWIERSYAFYKKPFVKIKNVADISSIKEGETQIIKFHGDFDDDDSIVLTESSYFQRLDFESPLDIKLRSDTLGKSILFIGYSLSDINIRYLLYKLQKIWESTPHMDRRPKSYLFLLRPNPIQEKVLAKRGIKTLVSEHENQDESLEKFLEKILSDIKP